LLLTGVVALALVGTLASILIAFGLSRVISLGFAHQFSAEPIKRWLALVLAFGIVKSLTIWGQEVLAQVSATKAKSELRIKLFAKINQLGADWLKKSSVAELNLLATTGLDALDAYFSKFLPQLVYTALATPIFIVVTWMTDPTSGIILTLTLPLVPLFMVLIGRATQSVQSRQLAAMTQLAKHFLEVLRGLPTLRIFGRAKTQLEIIQRVSDEYSNRTIKVLRVSFLSGFALELISSLSVALIAVTVGLRLVNADVSLAAGLFVLLMAPDAFLPIRQVGAHFHASAEGVEVSGKVLDIIDLEPEREVRKVPPQFEFEGNKITALVGKSGVGKSSIFQSHLGLIGAVEDAPNWLGETPSQRRSKVAWMPQQPMLQSGTIRENIIGLSVADEALAQKCLRAAGDAGLHLELQVGQSGQALSGGQAQRVALARTLYRLEQTNCEWLWLDEPTSS
jgi:ATP-binding cassette subfamily C protein CydD